ncbi:hypothetical protein AK812_SmicGene27920 [Symbiodinium microadriaticum]|uniref:Sulfotransferase domain-containing protein n=1 Tax=Symbiodinium microadriaticum TaxID=2951 RepID=A0A1Q9D5K4_SYMMI|nr:hypothetical protein AK812_SmicGene27920 [Symbiodinium microadriaticum]
MAAALEDSRTTEAEVDEEQDFSGEIAKMIRRWKNEKLEAPRRLPAKTKLISVGFARTGTTSFVTALKQLGYTPCHDNEVMEVADLLAQRFNDTHPMPVGEFLHEFGLRGFDVLFWFSYEIVDWVVQHPEVDIKFVLTYRDSGRKWAESWASVAHGMDILSSRPFIWIERFHGILKAYKHLLWEIQTQGRPELRRDVEALEESYYKHIERIRAMIPPDKLLEFNLNQGWKPLCEFLGLPVPDIKMPHVNDRVVMQALLATLGMITWIWPLVPLLLAYGLLVFSLKVWREVLWSRGAPVPGARASPPVVPWSSARFFGPALFQLSATSLFWPSGFSGVLVFASPGRLATRSLFLWSSGSQVL